MVGTQRAFALQKRPNTRPGELQINRPPQHALLNYGHSHCQTPIEISSFYGLIHKSQLGGLPNRRCSDHIFQLLVKYRNCPSSYSLYIDFNKAFNTVPHGSLSKTLEHYRLSSPLIRNIRGLYRAPPDYPVVNGHTSASHLQTRGVRQGCPLSPILFVLYVNVLLFIVPHYLSSPITQHESSHAFVDDLLYRS